MFDTAALQRRGLLGLLGLAPWANGGLAGCASTGSGSPARGLARVDVSTAYRLANRLSWGATDAEVERVERLGADGYISEQPGAAAGELPAVAQAQIAAMRMQSTLPLALRQ